MRWSWIVVTGYDSRFIAESKREPGGVVMVDRGWLTGQPHGLPGGTGQGSSTSSRTSDGGSPPLAQLRDWVEEAGLIGGEALGVSGVARPKRPRRGQARRRR
jgi:hypothetical protein